MNVTKYVACVLLVVMVILSITDSQFIITKRRRFPGERRLGAANYGQYTYGKRGFKHIS
ncbi:hypothetical protein SK128_006856, partial [Halocaridina rubra]